ncbi:branched-chain amino acid ABC transporter permease [Janibacter melonis]|uniref:branched-chain amino acid ABC transporter permease n=1 Tax=Janibacter melonis TaxID=262209 RepID=UPI00177AC2E9|nr:branched-chain amino acid ABC transporter permease [Janibacter melonis]
MNPSLVLLQSAAMFAMAGGVLALSTYVKLWAGVLSFATVSFAAVGAYLAVWLNGSAGMGVVLSLMLSMLVTGALGLVVGRLFLRLSSHWMALATVALMLITRVFITNLGEYTGGSEGQVVPFTFSLPQMALMLVLVCLLMWALKRSKFGVAADTTREDPDVASALGVHVGQVKVIAFGVSGLVGALGGSMQASQLSYIDPNTFYIDLAVTIVASVVLGGAYHWLGSVIGAAVFTGMPVYISQYITEGQSVINGALLLLIIIFLPGGLIDPLRWRRLRERRSSRAHDGGTPTGGGAASEELEQVGAAR